MLRPAYQYSATVIEVTDGDTVKLMVDLGLEQFSKKSFRFYKVNAPEIGTPEGKVAKAFVEKRLPPGAKVIIRTYKTAKDKYGRWVAEVFVGDYSMSTLLVETGHAVEKDY